MNKSELLDWLQEEYRKWEVLLDQIGPARIDQPGVNGDWSMKDVVAHLTVWNRWLAVRLEAALRGEPEPLRPWPALLQTDDEINAWIYDSNRGRPENEVLQESQQVFQQILSIIQSSPADTRIERVSAGRDFYLVWVGDQRFQAGEFFDHFHDDHEPDVRVWLAREEE